MKVFHELAFDGFVNFVFNFFWTDPVNALYPTSDPRLHELMGGVDALHVSGYASQVIGTNPTLTIFLQSSGDASVWYDSPTPPLINALPLSTTGETLFQASDDATVSQKFAYARLAISLNGTSPPSGLFRIWVTGRDFSRRAGTGHAARAPARSPIGRRAAAGAPLRMKQ